MNDVEVRDDNQNRNARQDKEIGALEALWSFFSSMKTAIVLLLLLAATSIAGTVVEQNQPEQFYIQNYTGWKHVLVVKLDLVDVYHSTWFVALLVLVGANLTVCSINRFGTAWRRTFQPKVETNPEQVSRLPKSEKLTFGGSVEDAAGKVVAALRSRSYRVSKATQGENISLHAAKGRVSIWAPYLTHLSILVIFGGAIFGSMLGFEGYTTITEGKDTSGYYPKGEHEKKDMGFRVALRKFTIEHDEMHRATAYKSDLRVYEGDKLVAQKIIDVNHPLTHKGIAFFQSSYGLVGFVLKITSPDGHQAQVPFDLSTQPGPQGNLYVISGEQPWKLVELCDKKLAIFPHSDGHTPAFAPDYVGGEHVNASSMPINPAVNIMINDRFPEYKGLEAWTRLGWVTLSKSADYKGYTVTLENVVDYTGLQVSRNPGLPIIYAGFALMTFGVFVAFYLNYKVVRVSICQSKSGATVVLGATSRGESDVFEKDFNRLRDALG